MTAKVGSDLYLETFCQDPKENIVIRQPEPRKCEIDRAVERFDAQRNLSPETVTGAEELSSVIQRIDA